MASSGSEMFLVPSWFLLRPRLRRGASETLSGATRLLQRDLLASENLLHAAIDAHKRVMRHLTRLRANGLAPAHSHP